MVVPTYLIKIKAETGPKVLIKERERMRKGTAMLAMQTLGLLLKKTLIMMMKPVILVTV